MNKGFGLVLAAFLAACGKAGSGAAAPDFSVALIHGPATKVSLKDLRGKLVVLEFWATWCAPCVESIPHMNELAGQMKDKPVVFLSVTDEDADVVSSFLKATPMAAWVAAGASDVFTAFGIHGRPTAVLIDKSGNLIGQAYPELLNAAGLELALAGKKPQFEPTPTEAPATGSDLVSIEISTVTSGASFSDGEDGFTTTGLPISEIASLVCGINDARVTLGKGVKDVSFALSARGPMGSRKRLCEPVLRALELAAPVKFTRVKKTVPVYLVRASAQGSKLKKSAPSGEMSWGGGKGRFEAKRIEFSALLAELESRLDTPLIDETGYSGRFDALVTWNPKKPSDLEHSIENQLGLDLSPAKRPVEFLQVEALASAAAKK